MMGSLEKTIILDHQEITEFFESQPEVYDLLDMMIISSRSLIMSTAENLPEDNCSTWRYMLWRTMYDYIETSLLLLIKTRIDEGYALLRMAAELSRDIARIAENQDNFKMWENRRKLHRENSYKKIFRFNTSDKTEKMIFKLYNLASEYGVHSHQTRDMHLSHIGKVVNGNFIETNVSEQEMLKALRIWLFSFFPLHVVVGKTFSGVYARIFPNPFKNFLDVESLVFPALQEFKKNCENTT